MHNRKMKLKLRNFEWLPAMLCLLLACAAAPRAAAQNDADSPPQILLQDLNQSRSDNGLEPLAYDEALAVAAQRHAELMARAGVLEHQLPGEPGLAQRCGAAGALFSSIAENIAEGGSLHQIHASWMSSPAHHDNILSPVFAVVGIGIARRGGTIYAVEDFSIPVSDETTESVEQKISDMLAARGIKPTVAPNVARAVCIAGSGEYAGPPPTPGMVIRFASPQLEKLGPILDQKVPPGRFHTASVGACNDTNSQGFMRYKVAVLLY
jgi:hypothetical protein